MKKPAKNPCRECPWRRKAIPGWLGHFTIDYWLALAHSDADIACHLTVVDANGDEIEDEDQMRHCTGANTYRTNVCKSVRNWPYEKLPADREKFFGSRIEFITHHERDPGEWATENSKDKAS